MGCTWAEHLISGLTPKEANQKPQPRHTAPAHPMDEPLQSMLEGHAGSLAGLSQTLIRLLGVHRAGLSLHYLPIVRTSELDTICGFTSTGAFSSRSCAGPGLLRKCYANGQQSQQLNPRARGGWMS